MKKIMFALALLALPVTVQAKDIGFTNAQQVTDHSILNSGDYFWNDDPSLGDDITVRVNLTTQMAYVERGGVLIGATNVSSGRPGYETPHGVFTILGKETNHHSKHYDADMHWTMWVNNDGVALHSGGTPGRPSSHGCVHLPETFAAQLYQVAQRGMTVEITDNRNFGGLVLNLN